MSVLVRLPKIVVTSDPIDFSDIGFSYFPLSLRLAFLSASVSGLENRIASWLTSRVRSHWVTIYKYKYKYNYKYKYKCVWVGE